ncbi:Hypothetical predicted protein [Mytilus galloprovincialis]|uniref:DZIP3-like HEPN domain-containing protein n=1 Tax=Mytilus galloprovincialis TaxID=29158 RepID=A0A8B6HJ57_MYTGA|nr:Hypothetical predicted protein [Mytilus galloprovincialis]
MTCLLRHLANIKIEDCLPLSSDKSVAADLSRIKTYRNKVEHCEKGILSHQEFNKYWNDISQAIIRLGGPKYQQRCDDLKKKEFDATDKDLLNELKNLRGTTIPKGVEVITETLLEEWSQKDERVVRTRAIQTLIKAIDEKAVVTIIGPPGCGKSTSAHHVAVYLNKSMAYEVIPAKRASDIVQYYNPLCNQVFVFDDICGKYTLDKQKVVEWRDLTGEINILTKNKRIKVLATCRSYIFKERIIANIDILSSNCVDSTSEYCCLSKKKLDITRVFFDKDNILALQKSKQYTILFFGQNYFELCLEIGHPEVIRDHFQFESILHNSAIQQRSCKIKVSISLEESYFNRLCQDVSKGRVDDVFNNIQLTNVHFQTKFVQYFKNRQDLRDKLLFLSDQASSPLLSVARNGYYPIAEMLIKIGLNVNVCDGAGRTPLFLASECGYTDIADLLLQNHANAKICDKKDRSPLHIASARGLTEIVVLFFKNDVINITTENAMGPLYMATVSGNIDIVQLLLEHGFDPNVQTKDKKKTPIYAAFYYNHLNIVKVLLSFNCKTDIFTDSFQSPIYVACLNGFKSVVKLLLENGSDPDLFKHQIIKPFGLNCSILRNIDSFVNKTYESPIFIASQNGYFDIVKLLLDHHCNPNFGNVVGQSPVYMAAKQGHIDIVELLLKYKADPNIIDRYCESPLLQAASLWDPQNQSIFEHMGDLDSKKADIFIRHQQARLKIVKLFLQNNADPNVCNVYCETPLSAASRRGFVDIVNALLTYYADPDICNHLFQSPLFIASKNGHLDIVNVLLEFNADPNLWNENSESPLFIASKNGHSDTVRVLLKFNAKPNGCNKNIDSPLYIATNMFQKAFFQKHLSVEEPDRTKQYREIIKLLLTHHADPLFL